MKEKIEIIWKKIGKNKFPRIYPDIGGIIKRIFN